MIASLLAAGWLQQHSPQGAKWVQDSVIRTLGGAGSERLQLTQLDAMQSGSLRMALGGSRNRRRKKGDGGGDGSSGEAGAAQNGLLRGGRGNDLKGGAEGGLLPPHQGGGGAEVEILDEIDVEEQDLWAQLKAL